MSISISSAPSLIQVFVSKTLIDVADAPIWNPTTATIFMFELASSLLASLTKDPLMQTAKKL